LILLVFRRRTAADLTALRWVREWADVAGWFFWTYADAGAILCLGELPGAGGLTRDGAIAQRHRSMRSGRTARNRHAGKWR
jgi:hypothetical protein